jgi:hypothetical protein
MYKSYVFKHNAYSRNDTPINQGIGASFDDCLNFYEEAIGVPDRKSLTGQ